MIVSAADLRAQGLNIPEEVAVETAACDLWRHMESNSLLKELMTFKHVLVRDHDGVFHFNKDRGDRFDYYSRPFEGGPESNPGRYGVMSGYGKILITSIVTAMLRWSPTGSSSSESDAFSGIPEGICSALRLWAKHFEIGFSSREFLEYIGFLNPDFIGLKRPSQPFDHLWPDEKPDEKRRNKKTRNR